MTGRRPYLSSLPDQVRRKRSLGAPQVSNARPGPPDFVVGLVWVGLGWWQLAYGVGQGAQAGDGDLDFVLGAQGEIVGRHDAGSGEQKAAIGKGVVAV